MMSLNLLLQLSGLLGGLIVIGSILCLPLFSWNIRRLVESSLFTKIIWWVPIFLVLIFVLYTGIVGAIIVTVLLIVLSLGEFIKNKGYKYSIARLYYTVFLVAIAHLAFWFLLPSNAAILLAVVCLVSIMSDVCAFFFGNFIRGHKLPAWINNHKSWEGVAGQLIGAGIGALLAWAVMGVMLPVYIVLAIGVASAVGDILNSITKRILGIKDWGKTIPGHGGILDRLSSLSLALAVSFWIFYLLPVAAML